MKAALIKNGEVENIIESSSGHNDRIANQYDAVINVSALSVGIGWGYDGSTFTPPPKTQEQIAQELEMSNANNLVTIKRQNKLSAKEALNSIDLEKATTIKALKDILAEIIIIINNEG